jgi:hypothetical protein
VALAAAERAPLRRLYTEHVQPDSRAAAAEGASVRREDAYQGPLLAAFVLFLLSLRRTDRRRP